MSGIADFIAVRGQAELIKWCESAWNLINHKDKSYSRWYDVPHSIKHTSVKPSGTVSLLAGVSPGMHYPEARFYIRRITLSKASQLIEPLKRSNFPIEPKVQRKTKNDAEEEEEEEAEEDSVIVEFPICAGPPGMRTAKDVSMWEQAGLGKFCPLSFPVRHRQRTNFFVVAALLQAHFADNQVSCTITFDPETEGPQLEHLLNQAQFRLKGVSFLPRLKKGAYAQMPYEEITEEEYHKRLSKLILPIQFGKTNEKAVPERYCNTDRCTR
jgi:hypothetical protein